MKKYSVVFIAGTEYDNLGIGYMSAILAQSGIETKLVSFQEKKSEILRIIKKADPLLIGFSILYLNYIKRFIDIIAYLRSEGIRCHFTAGGHYASLRPEEVLNMMPGLDSVVRFEGEYTLLAIVNCLKSGTKWKQTESLAYWENGKVKLNALRSLEKDLDKFPYPHRAALKNYAFKKKFATIIAGRGCIYECSFCNSRRFYKLPGGPVKRIRQPELVVKEMEYLYNFKECSVFLFQDDDFPVKSKSQPDWLIRFCNELERTGLSQKIMWKISCRPDEVEEDAFSHMKKHGLFNIFLGIEDGTNSGLKNLNKNLTVEKTLQSISVLKKLGIGFEFGFILFQPATTFSSLNENIDFLKQVCSDGYSSVPFQKLVPLFETRSEKELIDAGRLKVPYIESDYDFLEEAMNHYYDFVFDCFNKWLRGAEGVDNLSKWSRNYFAVFNHYFEDTPEAMKIYRKLRKVIEESNLFMLDTMKELATIFETNQYKNENTNLLKNYRKEIKSKHQYFRNKILITMARLVSLVEEQQVSAHV